MFINIRAIALYGAVLISCASSIGIASANTWLDLDESEDYTARHEASFVQAGDRFYLFGGRENPQTVDTYDYQQDSWTRSASTPIPFNHFQATEYQGLIWVIGAFKDNGFPREQPAEYIYTYDPANDVWIQGREIPAERRRGSTGLVNYQGKFYVVGGNTIGHDGGYVPWFDVFDPETGTWTALADAPNSRDHFHATVANDKLYVAGGRLSGGPGGTFAPLIASVDVYDFATQTWTTLPASGDLPTPRAGTSTVTFQGNVVVIGGEGNGQAYDTVEQLNPLTNLWTEIASLNHARHGTQALVSGEGIFTLVGSPRQGGGRQHNLEAFNSGLPVGDASTAASLQFTETEIVLNSSEPQVLTVEHVAGSQGALITSIELNGNNASSFVLTEQAVLPNLVLPQASKNIVIAANNAINGDFASLTISYDNGASTDVDLRFDPLIEQPTLSNLSLGKAATQSTTGFGGSPARAVDGNTSGVWRNGSVTHTVIGANEGWWQVDLGVRSEVQNIVIHNRTDCCSTRLADFYVFVSETPFENRSLSSLINDENITQHFHPGTLSGSSISISMNGIGRYVRVQQTSNQALSLAEVQVMGTELELPPASNLALAKPVSQSTTGFNGSASRAVDGNTSGRWRDGSVTHTRGGVNEGWWQVDLQQQALIQEIILYNRTDSCCTQRLSDFYVFVSQTPFEGLSLAQLLEDSNIERHFHAGSLSGTSISIPASSNGRYVRVQQTSDQALSLAEVEVIGSFVAE